MAKRKVKQVIELVEKTRKQVVLEQMIAILTECLSKDGSIPTEYWGLQNELHGLS